MKRVALSQIKQQHRDELITLIEKQLTLSQPIEKAVIKRIISAYSLFNAEDKIEELDVIEKGKVVVKLSKKGDLVNLSVKRRTQWIEVPDIPLHVMKFS